MTTNSSNYLTELHKLVERYFDLEEVRTLCFDLNVDYDNVRGEGKSARIRELLLALARSGRLENLITLAQSARPHIAWPHVPTDFQLPTSLASKSISGSSSQYHVYGDLVQGNKVDGDQVDGDQITIRDISNSQGVAIGRGASSHVSMQQGVSEHTLNELFAPLLAQVAQHEATAVPQVESLKAEVAKGEEADDETMADLIGAIAEAAPAAVEGIVNLFTNAVVAKIAGAATRYMLKRIRRQ